MSMPSGMELFIIVLIILILFGGKKIPELAKGLGTGIKNFKKAVKEEDEEVAVVKKSEEIDDKKVETTASQKEELKNS